MGKLDGRVAFITGAARGQGRSHAVRLAEEGADIIAVDLCAQIASVPYPMATDEDLKATVRAVEATGRGIVAERADVRDVAQLRAVFERGVEQLGPVDIVVANAGIGTMSPEPKDEDWDDVIDVNLKGVFNAVRVATPSMVERGQGGAIVMTSSTAGLVGVAAGDLPGVLGYTASKHGVIGLMRSWANSLAPANIRVNVIAPSSVNTPMVVNGITDVAMANDPTLAGGFGHALPVGLIEASDISNVVLFLVSDDGRYITGTVLPVDAGSVNKR